MIIGIIAVLVTGLTGIAAASPSDSGIITKLNLILTKLDAITTQITNSVNNIVYELDLIDMHVGDVQASVNTTGTVVDSIQSSVGSDLQGAVGDVQDAVNSKVTMESWKSDEITIPYGTDWDSCSETYSEVRHISLTLFYDGMTSDGHDHDIIIKTFTDGGWKNIAEWSNLLGDPYEGTKIIQFDTDNWYIHVFNSGAESQVDMHIVYYFTSTYVPAEAP
jgi:hypothetical protein